MDKKRFSLLGGTVLFGYLGCQSPEGGPGAPVAGGKPDTLAAKDTIKLVGPTPPQSLSGPLVVRTGPTAGEPCTSANSMGACTREGVFLMCMGAMREMLPYNHLERFCVPGDTLVHYRHFGFTGIDRAGSRRAPERMLRDLRT